LRVSGTLRNVRDSILSPLAVSTVRRMFNATVNAGNGLSMPEAPEVYDYTADLLDFSQVYNDEDYHR
jgi:hypothetical protein